jgi:hypothetical protein
VHGSRRIHFDWLLRRDLDRAFSAEDLHFIETADGRLVCLPSLLK